MVSQNFKNKRETKGAVQIDNYILVLSYLYLGTNGTQRTSGES